MPPFSTPVSQQDKSWVAKFELAHSPTDMQLLPVPGSEFGWGETIHLRTDNLTSPACGSCLFYARNPQLATDFKWLAASASPVFPVIPPRITFLASKVEGNLSNPLLVSSRWKGRMCTFLYVQRDAVICSFIDHSFFHCKQAQETFNYMIHPLQGCSTHPILLSLWS